MAQPGNPGTLLHRASKVTDTSLPTYSEGFRGSEGILGLPDLGSVHHVAACPWNLSFLPRPVAAHEDWVTCS